MLLNLLILCNYPLNYLSFVPNGTILWHKIQIFLTPNILKERKNAQSVFEFCDTSHANLILVCN